MTGQKRDCDGSNSGIGLGVARELGARGADVVLNSFTDRDEDHALAAEIAAEFGVNARYIAADMSQGDQCRRLIEDGGRCDVSWSTMRVSSMWRRLTSFRRKNGTRSLRSI